MDDKEQTGKRENLARWVHGRLISGRSEMLADTLEFSLMTDFHDRFLIIDNIELHGLGSSINCLGRRVTSYSTRDAKEIAKLRAMLP